MSYMEESQIRVKFLGIQSALNIFLKIIGTIVALDIAKNKRRYLPVIGGWYHLTGRDCLDETRKNDIESIRRREHSVFRSVFWI